MFDFPSDDQAPRHLLAFAAYILVNTYPPKL
jgi:hypothetical protein